MYSCEGPCQEVLKWMGLAYAIMGVLNVSIWCFCHLCRRTRIGILKPAVLSILFYCCERWTLYSDFERRINVFGTMCRCRTMGYSWNDFVKRAIILWYWFEASYLHSPSTLFLAMWAWGRQGVLGCLCTKPSSLDEASETSKHLVIGTSR